MILVTGATGFLGNHLVELLLSRGADVRILCRRPPSQTVFDASAVQLAIGDVTEPSTLSTALEGVRQVYHAAGRVDFNPPNDELLNAVNVQGTRNVLEAATRAEVDRVLHVSSVSTIGATADPEKPLGERDFGRGLGVDLPYPHSKLRGERIALEYADRGLPLVIVNPTFFAGPDDVNLSSARAILSFLNRQTWVGLTVGGFGYTDVRDVAAGAVAAMERGEHARRYILGGHNLLNHEFHALLEQLTGLRAPRLRIGPKPAMVLAFIGAAAYRAVGVKPYVGPGDVRLASHYWFYDYSRAREELGLVCREPAESLKDALQWLADRGYYRPKHRQEGDPDA